MDKDIRSWVPACQTCALSKPAQNCHWGLLASEFARRPMQKIFIDYVGKLPGSKAGNTAILVFADAFSKFVWLVPVREATIRITIKALKVSIFGSFLSRSFECEIMPRVSLLGNSDNFVSCWGSNTSLPHFITHSLPMLSVLIRNYPLP